jgi:hypothetical protein
VRTLQIASEYNYQVLFALLVSTYKFLNPSDVSAKDPNFTSQSIKITSMYDLKKTNEKMESTIVKEPWSRKSWKKKTTTH